MPAPVAGSDPSTFLAHPNLASQTIGWWLLPPCHFLGAMAATPLSTATALGIRIRTAHPGQRLPAWYTSAHTHSQASEAPPPPSLSAPCPRVPGKGSWHRSRIIAWPQPSFQATVRILWRCFRSYLF